MTLRYGGCDRILKRLAILGSTGSIGRHTIEVVCEFPERFQVTALAAGSNLELLAGQARVLKPQYIALGREDLVPRLRELLGDAKIQILTGLDGLITLATLPEVDQVVTAVVGSLGIRPTLAAINAGKSVALANKETLVAAGSIIMAAAARQKATIIPVDSEHSAVFQCLEGRDRNQVSRILLTASGGPFRSYRPEDLEQVTLKQALNHPNWSMGGKITIDSATMINKGLEIIEAHWLFGMDFHRIAVVLHPESIVHSMIELRDGAILGQMGLCDMRLPIQLALTYPERLENSFPKLDPTQGMELHFEPVNTKLFPAIPLAYQVGKAGGSLPAAFNAANETAVEAFRQGRLKFTGIVRIVSEVIGHHQKENFSANPDLDEILEVDNWARATAGKLIELGR